MATRNIVVTEQGFNSTHYINIFREGGAISFKVGIATDGPVKIDERTIALADCSLTGAQKTALSNALQTIYNDVLAQDPAYT